jgi:hypothetical protein
MQRSIIIVLLGAITSYGVHGGVKLLRVRPRAVLTAAIFFLMNIVYCFIMVFHDEILRYTCDLRIWDSVMRPTFEGDIPARIFPPIFWLIYLSSRAENTPPTAARLGWR